MLLTQNGFDSQFVFNITDFVVLIFLPICNQTNQKSQLNPPISKLQRSPIDIVLIDHRPQGVDLDVFDFSHSTSILNSIRHTNKYPNIDLNFILIPYFQFIVFVLIHFSTLDIIISKNLYQLQTNTNQKSIFKHRFPSTRCRTQVLVDSKPISSDKKVIATIDPYPHHSKSKLEPLRSSNTEQNIKKI